MPGEFPVSLFPEDSNPREEIDKAWAKTAELFGFDPDTGQPLPKDEAQPKPYIDEVDRYN